MPSRRGQRDRTIVFMSVKCAMCGEEGIVKWSKGKGGTNPPRVWLCVDHGVNQ